MNEIAAVSTVAVLLPAVMVLLRAVIGWYSRTNEATSQIELLLKDAQGHKVAIVFGKDSSVEERAKLVDSKVQELM